MTDFSGGDPTPSHSPPTGDAPASASPPDPAAPPAYFSEKPNRSKTPFIVAAVVAVIAIGALVWYLNRPTHTDGAPQAAVDACRAAVKSDLKSPATAQFDPDALPVANPSGEDIWIIGGTVDSQNSFGALVRNVYICSAAKSQKPPPEYLGFVLSLKEGTTVDGRQIANIASSSS